MSAIGVRAGAGRGRGGRFGLERWVVAVALGAANPAAAAGTATSTAALSAEDVELARYLDLLEDLELLERMDMVSLLSALEEEDEP